MKKIWHWLLKKIKKDMQTDPFTIPPRRTKLSYYFDSFASIIFYLSRAVIKCRFMAV